MMTNSAGIIFEPRIFGNYINPTRFSNVFQESRNTPVSDVQKIEALASQANKILHKSSTVFPFTIFPTDIVIDEVKVSVLHRTFFGSGQTHAVAIPDILDVNIQTSLFFAMLSITIRNFLDNPLEVSYLRKRDAQRARKIIQGLMILMKEKVNYSKIGTSYLKEKIQMLGEINATL